MVQFAIELYGNIFLPYINDKGATLFTENILSALNKVA